MTNWKFTILRSLRAFASLEKKNFNIGNGKYHNLKQYMGKNTAIFLRENHQKIKIKNVKMWSMQKINII